MQTSQAYPPSHSASQSATNDASLAAKPVVTTVRATLCHLVDEKRASMQQMPSLAFNLNIHL